MNAVADDKKDDKKPPKKIESYTDKVTVRKWNGTVLQKPEPDVPAFRTEFNGKTVIYTAKQGVDSPKDSEITDADGATWVVTESIRFTGNFTYYRNYVVKKDDKKP